ncbi:MAG TPA: hypothetical protein VHX20_13690 [Terracidiphilus sp.]|jgi:outer membrane protein assembly factor BamB|nr:hypothetical protein [Terracidiphilus sp.]
MRRFLDWSLTLFFVASFLGPAMARAQARGRWHVAGGDAAHEGWQKAESKISSTTVASSFKLLWKLKLGNEAPQAEGFSEPLATPSIISGRGFKDIVLWGDSNSLYAVDYALGTLLWQKDFHIESAGSSGSCSGSHIQILMDPPRVIHFGARRSHTSHSTSEPPPPATADRWIGSAAAGGYFSLNGVYALTRDGYLHEQILATGLDYAPAVKFLPASAGDLSGLNMNDKFVYTESNQGCGDARNAVWSIDLNTPEHSVASYPSQKVHPVDLTGPAIGSDGTVYISTGAGTSDDSVGVYASSVVALAAKDLKVKDWYTPLGSGKRWMLNVSPVVVHYKDKDLVAAAGKNGSIVLLDSESLGGKDHHTPLAETSQISKASGKGAWESLASWLDNSGGLWVLASISAPVQRDVEFASTNGSAPHGSVVAFKVEDKDGHPVLTPAWISRDLRNPAPPTIVNGVVFALAGGDASDHAILYALDATTGKELYSSGDAVPTYTHLSGVSAADGHVFFTTHDNTLYSFGIPMEH